MYVFSSETKDIVDIDVNYEVSPECARKVIDHFDEVIEIAFDDKTNICKTAVYFFPQQVCYEFDASLSDEEGSIVVTSKKSNKTQRLNYRTIEDVKDDIEIAYLVFETKDHAVELKLAYPEVLSNEV